VTSAWVWIVVVAVWFVAAGAVLAVSEVRAERRDR
jgi:hypothetical protein